MFESTLDQASGLRRLFNPRRLRLLPVVADTRPGGSAVFALNLAVALSRVGSRPVVIDAHRAGVSALVGLEPRFELDDLIEGRCRAAQVLCRSAEGVPVLPASRGLGPLCSDPLAADAVFSAVASLREGYDVAVFHASGALLGSLMPSRTTETALLCGPAEADLALTYAWLKALVRTFSLTRFRVFFDGVGSERQAQELHRRLSEVSARYLDAAVMFGGAVGGDPGLDLAVRSRASVFSMAAQGPAARAFEGIAGTAREWLLPAFTPSAHAVH
jgi:flagellar biosynthesis protein FlhG